MLRIIGQGSLREWRRETVGKYIHAHLGIGAEVAQSVLSSFISSNPSNDKKQFKLQINLLLSFRF